MALLVPGGNAVSNGRSGEAATSVQPADPAKTKTINQRRITGDEYI